MDDVTRDEARHVAEPEFANEATDPSSEPEVSSSGVDTSPVLAAYVVIAMFWAVVGLVVGALVW